MHGIRPGTRKQASKSPITPKRFCRSPAGREIYRVGGLIKSVEAKKFCRSVADWRVGWAGCIFSAARQNYLESGGCRVKSLHTPLLLCREHAPITGSAGHNPAWPTQTGVQEETMSAPAKFWTLHVATNSVIPGKLFNRENRLNRESREEDITGRAGRKT